MRKTGIKFLDRLRFVPYIPTKMKDALAKARAGQDCSDPYFSRTRDTASGRERVYYI